MGTRYVRSSEERCSILKACHVDLTSGHMGAEYTSHRVLERFVLERCNRGCRKYSNITHFSFKVLKWVTLHLYWSLPGI